MNASNTPKGTPPMPTRRATMARRPGFCAVLQARAAERRGRRARRRAAEVEARLGARAVTTLERASRATGKAVR